MGRRKNGGKVAYRVTVYEQEDRGEVKEEDRYAHT